MRAVLRKARVGAVVATAAVLGLAGTVDAQALGADRARTTATAAPSAAAAVDYQTWKNDVDKVMDQAVPSIQERIQNGGGQKQAIVLDVDNTSLETYFQLFPPTPAVERVLELTRYANERGVGIFFITARPDILEQVTRGNLVHVGYPITGLYQRSLGDIFGDPTEYKTAKRAEIESLGYTIIANIGNNQSDLVGGHAERTFKLPDYDGQLS